MPDAANCTACGAPLSDEGVAEGLCGRCLVRLAIDAEADTSDRIGPYRLVEKIAEGGMGVVWKAEQQAPVRRPVAIKLIRPGLDSAQVLARFDAERQALALMDHPGIARIHDAGATDDGRPYFVMEYVAGEPVTAYCDRRKLGTRERLDLFLEICDAVQHAHHKGVVHRDIKPSNLLVAEREGKPAIKVIDFGIAKATQIRLTDRTLETFAGVAVGTPEYMSPEQASGSGLDVDTRTDVYALGVLLYELLVGVLPFDPAVLRRAALDEVLRTIREVDPPRPSERLHTLGDALAASAAQRSTESRTLEREIRGDLDWFAMKALEKDRNRRYGSPAELAADVKRHLEDEPVLAGPPSAAYRTRKFIRRHRIGVTISAATAVALAVGIVGTTYGLLRATRAEKQAREHSATSERVSDFLVGLFEVSDPNEARGRRITAREIFDKGAVKIDRELAGEPLIRAKMLRTFGLVYMNLGFLDQAERLLREAMSIQHAAGATADEAVTATALSTLCRLLFRLDESESLVRGALASWRQLGTEENLGAARAHYVLGQTLRLEHKFGDSDVELTRALEIFSAHADATPLEILNLYNAIKALRWEQNRIDDAEKLAREALAFARRNGLEDSMTAIDLQRVLGGVAHARERYGDAEATYRDVLDKYRLIAGGDTAAVVDALWNLQDVLRDQNRHAETAKVDEELVSVCEKVLGPDNADTIVAMAFAAESLRRCGRTREAATMLARARAVVESGGLREKAVGAIVACYEGVLSSASTAALEAAVDVCADGLTAHDADDLPPVVTITLLYDIAATAAAAGLSDQAMRLLSIAVDRDGRERFDRIPRFAPLRTHPDFPDLVRRGREPLRP